MDRLIALRVRMSSLSSRNRGFTTIEIIMMVLVAATFIVAIAYFVNETVMKQMFDNVKEVLGIKPKK